MVYKLIAVIPVNIGRWVKIDDKHGFDRGEGWRELYFEEAVIDWSWFGKDCYGKFAIEMKCDERTTEPVEVECQLSWVKAVRDGGRGKFNRIKGAYIKETKWLPWEIYVTPNYFPLPTYKGPVLLYLMGRASSGHSVAVAMYNLAIFRKVEDEVAKT